MGCTLVSGGSSEGAVHLLAVGQRVGCVSVGSGPGE